MKIMYFIKLAILSVIFLLSGCTTFALWNIGDGRMSERNEVVVGQDTIYGVAQDNDQLVVIGEKYSYTIDSEKRIRDHLLFDSLIPQLSQPTTVKLKAYSKESYSKHNLGTLFYFSPSLEIANYTSKDKKLLASVAEKEKEFDIFEYENPKYLYFKYRSSISGSRHPKRTYDKEKFIAFNHPFTSELRESQLTLRPQGMATTTIRVVLTPITLVLDLITSPIQYYILKDIHCITCG